MVIENPDNSIDTILNSENRVIKKISYEFPELRNYNFRELTKFYSFSEAIFANPSDIKQLSNFSQESAPRIEAYLANNSSPYIDFEDINTVINDLDLDKKLDKYSLLYNFRKTLFFPTNFSFTTGWNFKSVLETILSIEKRMPLSTSRNIISIIDFCFKNPATQNEIQAVVLYQDVVMIEIGIAIEKQIYLLFLDLIDRIPQLDFADSVFRIGDILNIPNETMTRIASLVEKDFIFRQ